MNEQMLPQKQIAANIRELLADDPVRYRNFGVFWYFIKAFLKRYYTRQNLYLLGDFEDPAVVALMPTYERGVDALRDALLTYAMHAENNANSAYVSAPGGEIVKLFDPDAGV